MSESPFSRVAELFRKKSALWIVALTVLGVLLLIFSSGGTEEAKDEKTFDEEAYILNLEARTSELIGAVQGAGQVRVMITVDSFYTEEYANDTTSEKIEDGQHSETHQESSVVLQTEKSGVHSPITERVLQPTIRGVSVVCSGGANAEVQMKIISLMCALFDLDSNQVSVTN